MRIIASFNFAEITELLFIELSKTRIRYLQILEIYSSNNNNIYLKSNIQNSSMSSEHIGGCNIGFLIG